MEEPNVIRVEGLDELNATVALLLTLVTSQQKLLVTLANLALMSNTTICVDLSHTGGSNVVSIED